MRTHFQAAVAADAGVGVEGDAPVRVGDRFGRAIFPAFAAQFACLVVDDRLLNDEPAHESAQVVGPHGQGAQFRKLKIIQDGQIAVDMHPAIVRADFPGAQESR